MSMKKSMTEWIRLVATPEDKLLLEEITRQNYDDNLSATVRKLIRQEADRRGIALPPTVNTEQPAFAD